MFTEEEGEEKGYEILDGGLPPVKEDDFVFIFMLSRPGASQVITTLEFRYFNPILPGVNDLLEIQMSKWEGMLWTIVRVPRKYRMAVAEVAREYGMTFDGGIPMMITSEGMKKFPLGGDLHHDVYGLVHDHGRKYQEMNSTLWDEIKAKETDNMTSLNSIEVDWRADPEGFPAKNP